MHLMFCFFHCFNDNINSVFKIFFSCGAEYCRIIFFLQMLQGQQKIVDCFSSLEQQCQDMDIRFRVSFVVAYVFV